MIIIYVLMTLCCSLEKSFKIFLPVLTKNFTLEKRFYVTCSSSFHQKTANLRDSAPLSEYQETEMAKEADDNTTTCILALGSTRDFIYSDPIVIGDGYPS